MKYFETLTRYFASLDNAGMLLWSVGYMVGMVTGLLFTPAQAIVATLVVLVVFIVIRVFSVRRHGNTVQLFLSQETADSMIKHFKDNKPQV